MEEEANKKETPIKIKESNKLITILTQIGANSINQEPFFS
jgi:hypothetical protein